MKFQSLVMNQLKKLSTENYFPKHDITEHDCKRCMSWRSIQKLQQRSLLL